MISQDKKDFSFLCKTQSSRGDLIRFIKNEGLEGINVAAEFFGFCGENQEIKKEEHNKDPKIEISNKNSEKESAIIFEKENREVSFLRVVEQNTTRSKDLVTEKPQWLKESIPFTDYNEKKNKSLPPEPPDLAPWKRLWPFLKAALGKMRRTRIPDVDKLVNEISNGKSVLKLPVKRLENWCPNSIIVLDFNERLIPFWNDMNKLALNILKILGNSGVEILFTRNEPFGKYFRWQDDSYKGKPFRFPLPHVPILIISDLGCYSYSGSIKKQWENLGNEFLKRGLKPVCLLPVPKRLWNENLLSGFNLIPWDRKINFIKELKSKYYFPIKEVDEKKDEEKGSYLLSMLSAAIRVEPSLLRTIRYLLPHEDKTDVGSEAQAWLSDFVNSCVIGFSFDQEKVTELRNRFKKNDDKELKKEIASKVKEYHSQFSEAIWAEESQNFKLLAGIFDKDADGYFSRSVSTALNESYPDHENFINWIKRLKIRQHEDIWNTNEKITALCAFAEKGDFKLPGNVDPRKYAWLNEPEKKEIDLVIKQIGNKLFIFEENKERRIKNFSIGSLVGTLKTNYRNLSMLNVKSEFFKNNKKNSDNSFPIPKDYSDKFRIKITTDCDEILIKSLKKPNWAGGIGRDNKGLFVILKKTGKRLYWVNPFPEFKRLNDDRLWWPENVFNALKGYSNENPSWADTFNYDGFGLFADVNIMGITQRFRWIPPGKFMMGSPEDEPERFSDEFLHEVTLTKGYWLADTACTQKLWQAVMGKNPSDFKGKKRPVENISYKDVLKFIDKLNSNLPELKLRLPTEAEWENACRAGTSTPFSFGENITTDQVNYNGKHPYNNGEKGISRGETVEVKSLPCNDWGLYEMHGNVWEWCKDWHGEYSGESVSDPAGPGAGVLRVLRGGCWFSNGGDARSAVRDWGRPDDRDDFAGFRLARGE